MVFCKVKITRSSHRITPISSTSIISQLKLVINTEDFTMDREDMGSILRISFNFQIALMKYQVVIKKILVTVEAIKSLNMEVWMKFTMFD